MAFQRGNQQQCVFPARASCYLTGVLTGMTAPANKTASVPRKFRGPGPILVTPVGTIPAGVGITAMLQPPNAGDYAAGILPTLLIATVGAGTGALTGDLLVIQC